MKSFEDLGFYCVDNLPPALLSEFVILAADAGIARLALSLDGRTGGPFGEALAALALLRSSGLPVDVLYLDADDQTLVRRYSETRRRHPLALPGEHLNVAIERQRAVLAPFRAMASRIWDTSRLTQAALGARIAATYCDGPERPLEVFVVSFGFKYGLPLYSDLVFDVRFLPNPNYEPDLKELAGTDRPVTDYLDAKPETAEFLAHLFDLLDYLLPRYNAEGKARLTIAFGCTGGRHRSVYVAERVAAHLKARADAGVWVEHRELQPA